MSDAQDAQREQDTQREDTPRAPTFGATWAIGKATYHASTRSRLNLAVALFGLALFAFLKLLSDASLNQDERLLKDMGLFLTSTLCLIAMIGLSAHSLYRELERKSVFSVVSKPIPRATLIWGKALGLAMTSGLLTSLCALTWSALAWRQGLEVSVTMYQAWYMIWCESLVVIGVGLLFGSFSTPLVSAGLTFGVTLVGRFSQDLIALYEKALRKGELTVGLDLAQLGLYLVPDLSLFNLSHAVVYGGPLPAEYILKGSLLSFSYTALCLLLAGAIFKRRDLI